jgi:hypothetical protein
VTLRHHALSVRRPRAALAGLVGAVVVLAAGGAAVAVPAGLETASATGTAKAGGTGKAGGTAKAGGAGKAGGSQAGQLAEGTPGYCPDKTGVTVVVDFNELGGGIVVRCAPGPIGSGYTGLDALQDAGFQPEGTRNWGLQFICRIAGKPAPDQKLPIKGDPNYREACINTPPAEAFWSYWYAPNGGTWTLSSEGPTSRDAIAGGFEGWSFSLNHSQDTAPPPGIAPKRPHQPPPTSPPPTTPHTSPPHSSPPPTHPTRGGGGHGGGSGGGSGSGSPTSPPVTSDPPSSPRHPPTSAPGSRSGSAAGGSHRNAANAATPSDSATTDNPVAVGHNGQGEKVSGELPASASRSGGGSATTAVVGILVLAMLAAGGFVAWRRRAGSG